MDTLLYNVNWMIWNILLGVIPLLLGYIMVTVPSKFLKYLLFVGWLLFIPNTVYVLTDLYHGQYQLNLVQPILLPILIAQYVILEVIGVILFVWGIMFFEKFLEQLKVRESAQNLIICLMNFLISFGVMVGRFQRTNSWEVFTNPMKAVNDIVTTIFMTKELIFMLFFGFICNLLYFGLRGRLKKMLKWM